MRVLFPRIFLTVALLFVSGISVYAQEGRNEAEPNNTRETATIVGIFELSGSVGYDGDSADWYQLSDQGNDLILTLTYDQNETDIDLTVYDNERVVAEANQLMSPDTVSCTITGTCFLKVKAYMGHGGYKIVIEPKNSVTPSVSSVRCSGPDEKEPNDGSLHAVPFGYGSFEGFACEDDTDWFRFQTAMPGSARITIEYDLTALDVEIRFFDADLLYIDPEFTTDPDDNSMTVSWSDVLYVRIITISGEGAYRLGAENPD